MADLTSASSLIDPPSHSSLPTDSIVQITILVTTKLDRDFLTWKSQIEPIIHGYGLSDHIDESFKPPPKDLVSNGVSTINPQFQSWNMQDQLLLGWMRSTITSTILSQYIASKAVAHLWSALHRVYAAVSSARVMELRRSLQSKTRGGRFCIEYFTQMLSFFDQLSSAGAPIPESDLVNYILTGLGPKFNSFVVALTTRSDPVSLADLYGFLLAHENLLYSQAQTSSSFSTDPTALYAAQNNRGRGKSRGSGRGTPNGSDPILPTPNFPLGRLGPIRPSNSNRGGYVQYYPSGCGGSNRVCFFSVSC